MKCKKTSLLSHSPVDLLHRSAILIDEIINYGSIFLSFCYIILYLFCFSVGYQIWSEMQSDFLPNFILCNTTQRFVRSSKVPPTQKPSVPSAKPSFYCGTQVSSNLLSHFLLLTCSETIFQCHIVVTRHSILYFLLWQDLNAAHQSFARLHSGFFGIPHLFSIVKLLGSRSLPWLIRALLDHISNKVDIAQNISAVQVLIIHASS